MFNFIIGLLVAVYGAHSLDPVGIDDHNAYLLIGLGIGMMIGSITGALNKSWKIVTAHPTPFDFGPGGVFFI